MSESILVPAAPEVMRAGLVCLVNIEVNGVDTLTRCVITDVNEPAEGVTVVPLPGEPRDDDDFYEDSDPFDSGLKWVRLDLRDPAVRDHLVRKLWTKLRPGEPEPLTAPCFWMPFSRTRRWILNNLDAPGPFYVGFDTVVPQSDAIEVLVPALASIDLASQDRDLLALAAVLTHVFGGGNGR